MRLQRGASLPRIAGRSVLRSPRPAAAEETIESFRSDITVAQDGTLHVAETIQVHAEGDKIKHGIYRDFPLTFEDADGAVHEVGFKLSPSRATDSRSRISPQNQGEFVRIYAGEESVFLEPRPKLHLCLHLRDRPPDPLVRGPRGALLERDRQRLGLPDRKRVGPRDAPGQRARRCAGPPIPAATARAAPIGAAPSPTACSRSRRRGRSRPARASPSSRRFRPARRSAERRRQGALLPARLPQLDHRRRRPRAGAWILLALPGMPSAATRRPGRSSRSSMRRTACRRRSPAISATGASA